jgi:hypothetical protein
MENLHFTVHSEVYSGPNLEIEAECTSETSSTFPITQEHNHHRTIPLVQIYNSKKKKKGKAIPVTGREGPYGCEMSRLSHFLDNRLTDDGEVVSLTRRPPFNPRRMSRPQGHSAAGRIRSIEKSNDLIGNRTHGLLALSIVTQPTTLPRAPNSKYNTNRFNYLFFSLLSLFWKNRVSSWDHVAVCVCVLVCVCVCIPPIVGRQRLGKIPLLLLGNGSVKIPLSSPGNGLVETLPR